ncbi:Ribonuclease H domain [Sesbania bispinosa]|nr:Ribonuclease H domain [Sesbania bispinosa]
MRLQNTSLLGKLVWDFICDAPKLWVTLIKSKYNGRGCRGSPVWNSIQKAWECLEDVFDFKLGNGDSSFWYSPWLSNMRLCDQVLAVDIHDITLKVRDIWNGDNWELSRLYTTMPEVVINDILQRRPFLADSIQDTMVWKHSLSGVYTASSGYRWLLDRGRELNTETSWRWVWKTSLPANLQFFIWLIGWDALPTNSTLHARGGFILAVCPLCLTEDESLPHCLIHCHLARGVWESLHLFSHIQPEQEAVTVQQVVSQILAYSFYVYKAFDRQEDLITKEGRLVSWQRPLGGYIALNVDGSAHLGRASYGGLLRDDRGCWIAGFWGNLGYSEILHAELQAIYYGLKLCWEKGYRFINCFSDSLLAVNLIKEPPGIHDKYATLLAAIHGLLQRAWTVTISHLLREGNTCADYLAKQGLLCDYGPHEV